MLKNTRIRNFYNSIIKDKFAGDYEFRRWFSNSRLRADFFMTYSAIKFHLQGIDFKECIELGPGPGTWTRILYKHKPEANFDLVDISKEMEHQFRLEMRGDKNVKYYIQDIMDFNPLKTYDFFFSARAIEYLEDKGGFFSKLFSLLNNGGRGIIITKNTKYKKYRIWGSPDRRFQHQGKISLIESRAFLEKFGFSEIKIYPVIIRLPVIDRCTPLVSEWIFKKVISRELSNNFLLWFVESYLISFKKR